MDTNGARRVDEWKSPRQNPRKSNFKKATRKLSSGPFKDLRGKQFQPIG